ncbi:sorting nexin-11 isoform X1 [Podarcis muralis]
MATSATSSNCCTNSKAFTAKTSCVRRRYREFVWLKKRLQKNAGLVPVPELPGKSTFFAGSTDEFIEKRRQGLQQFLEKVVQNVVLLSDSQLHLFLQSQLSIPEIEACVQGRGSLSVTDAILHYAMSNCGWVQEEDSHSALLAKGDFSSRDRVEKVEDCQSFHEHHALHLLLNQVPPASSLIKRARRRHHQAINHHNTGFFSSWISTFPVILKKWLWF